MTTDNARHQKKWRDRLLVQAKYFRELDGNRFQGQHDGLNWGNEDERPEVKALVDFFCAYPRCENMPLSLELDAENSCWVVTFANDNHYDIAAAHLALREVSSLPVKTIRTDGGRTCLDQLDDRSPCVAGSLTEHWVREISPEVKELRELDLWTRY